MNEGDRELSRLQSEFSELIIDRNNYIRTKAIDKGGYAQLWLVREKSTGKYYALKELIGNLTPKQVHQFAREIRTISSIHHPFCLNIYGFSTTAPFIFISEFIENGSLFHNLQIALNTPQKSKLTGTRRTLIAMGLSHAMCCLHHLGIIHRDLKSMNILLDSNYLPRLCDFGIARFLDSGLLTVRIGTPQWMAPEILNGSNYGSPVDVYSFGMVLYEMITNFIPWGRIQPKEVLKRVCIFRERPVIPSSTPSNLKTLIESCWSQNPQDRPTFAQIYEAFRTHEIFFPNTDFTKVDEMAEFLSSVNIQNNSVDSHSIYSKRKRSNSDSSELQSENSIASKTSHMSLPKQSSMSQVRKRSQNYSRHSDDLEINHQRKSTPERSLKIPKQNTPNKPRFHSPRRVSVDETYSSDVESSALKNNSENQSFNNPKSKSSTILKLKSKNIPKNINIKDNSPNIKQAFSSKNISIDNNYNNFDNFDSPFENNSKNNLIDLSDNEKNSDDISKKYLKDKKSPGIHKSQTNLENIHFEKILFQTQENDNSNMNIKINEKKVNQKLRLNQSVLNFNFQNSFIQINKILISDQFDSHNFVSELHLSTINLGPSQSREFFSAISSNFSFFKQNKSDNFNLSDFSKKHLFLTMLQCVYDILKTKEIFALDDFCFYELHKKLPFSNPSSKTNEKLNNKLNDKANNKLSEKTNDIENEKQNQKLNEISFDILNFLFKKRPELFSDDFQPIMSSLIIIDPKKSLILLQLQASSFKKIQNWWALLDLLIHKFLIFQNADLGSEVLSTLFSLLQEPSFISARLSYCIDIFISALSGPTKQVITSYSILISFLLKSYNKNINKNIDNTNDIDNTENELIESLIVEKNEEIEARISPKLILLHLNDEYKMPYCLRFLLLLKNPFKSLQIISKLFELSLHYIESTLVLCQIANSEDGAELILQVQNGEWLNEDLPTIHETMRLFVSILKHQKLRKTLITTPGTSTLLKKLCETHDEKVLEHIYLVFKGINWTEEEIMVLSSNNVISEIFQCGLDKNNEQMILIVIKIAQILVKVKNIPEIKIISSKASSLMKISNLVSQEIQVLLALLDTSKDSKKKNNSKK